jgi:hypothetical protein
VIVWKKGKNRVTGIVFFLAFPLVKFLRHALVPKKERIILCGGQPRVPSRSGCRSSPVPYLRRGNDVFFLVLFSVARSDNAGGELSRWGSREIRIHASVFSMLLDLIFMA